MRSLQTILSNSQIIIINNNNLIKELSSKGQWLELLSYCHEMMISYTTTIGGGGGGGRGRGDPNLYPPLLKACTNLNYFNYGTSVHACLIKHGFESFSSISNSTVNFYIKCGFLKSARKLFDERSDRDSVSWNVMIHGYLNLEKGLCKEEGFGLFFQARIAGFEPNISTLVLVIRALRDIGEIDRGLGFHGFLIRSGFSAVVSVQNSLLSLYTETSEIRYAQQLFDEMLDRDVISWSVMIGGYVKNGDGQAALRMFREMFSREGIEPDELTVVSILKACTYEKEIDLGRLVHCYVIRRGFSFDTFVGNSLIDMYSKCLYTSSAFDVFEEMPRKNVVSWNSILSGFVHNEWYLEALKLFDSMQKTEIESDEVTLVTLLQAYKNFIDPGKCKSIHSRVVRRGYDFNELVVNALIDAYAKCNLVELAWKLFDRMERRDMISWSTMITAFSHSGKTDESVNLFKEMVLVQGNFNAVTMLSLLEACAVSAELRRCKWAHGLAIRSGLAAEVAVGTALLDMYSKCGEIDLSRRVFDQMPDRNIVSWSAMIAAYGMNGRARNALDLFSEMELHGLKPNAVTMLSILSACGHGGLVDEGTSLFERMINDSGMEISLEHYSCMVDMLGRAGIVESAMDFIKKMPERQFKDGASVWGALLSACRNYGNSEIGGGAVARVLELEPMSSAGYMLGSSMYAANGLWREAAKMRRLVKEKGVKVVSGYSLVHVYNKAYRFVAGDGSHEQSGEIYSAVEQLHSCMKKGRNDVFIT